MAAQVTEARRVIRIRRTLDETGAKRHHGPTLTVC